MSRVIRFTYVKPKRGKVVHMAPNAIDGTPTWCGRFICSDTWKWIAGWSIFPDGFRKCAQCQDKAPLGSPVEHVRK